MIIYENLLFIFVFNNKQTITFLNNGKKNLQVSIKILLTCLLKVKKVYVTVN